jgi:hypothetical protein
VDGGAHRHAVDRDVVGYVLPGVETDLYRPDSHRLDRLLREVMGMDIPDWWSGNVVAHGVT